MKIYCTKYYRVEDAVVRPDPVTGELEGPVHGEEDGGVEDAGLVVPPRVLAGLQVHHVHDLRDAEAAPAVGPDHFVLKEPRREPNSRPVKNWII